MTLAKTTDVRTAVLDLFRTKLRIEVASDTENLLQSGRLDSLGLVELLVLLEEQFGLQVDLDRLDLEQLRSVEAICRMVNQQREPSDEDQG